mmetsp:Transcript_13922/g.25771  ORF Transcript_13922/g.25771 Transcript_13922/m.25771 type:complete len:424 (-) Transcript_13922:124-1395(-)
MASSCTCYPASRDGNEYNVWIAEHFGECLYSPSEVASFYVGMMSLVFWVACSTPQFLENYRRKSAGALSKWFLLEWFLGDALNASGAFLTHQLPTQLATATLFLINDTLMILQVGYYTYFEGAAVEDDDSDAAYEPLLGDNNGSSSYGRGVDGEDGEDDDAVFTEAPPSSSLQPAVLATTLAPVVFAMISNNKFGAAPGFNVVALANEDPSKHQPDVLPNCEPDNKVHESTAQLGMIIGWISGFIYLNSRIPQILKNQRRRSVEGLSITMFACAVMGNTTYGLGVLLKDPSWKAIKKALPWLVGSLGTLVLDFTILLQFWWFHDEDNDDEEDETNDVDTLDTSRRQGATGARARHHRRPPITHGLYGVKAWNTSPFFKPMSRGPNAPPIQPLGLRDSTSVGILPLDENVSLSAAAVRERSGSQ